LIEYINILCTEWKDLLIKLNQKHHVKIVRNDAKEIGLLINNRLTIRQFYDESRKKTYVNFYGEYFASCLDTFREKLRNHNLQINTETEYRITDSGVSELSTLTYNVDSEPCSLKLNWLNSGFFSLILENDSILAKELNLVEQLLEIFLRNQEIETVPIVSNKLPNLSIGIIAEFGFPVNDLVIILKEQLMVFGYQDSDIVDTMLTGYDVNSRKIQIITNIESRDDIKKLKTKAKNKFILIGAGLEYGLSSICRTRLVKAYNKRFEDRDNCNAADFKKIAVNLKQDEYVILSEGVNKCFHQADFFINYLSDEDINDSLVKMNYETKKFLELIFGNQFITPTQDEFMMYMAFTSALRSADLSRQVGAIITSKHGDVIASGTNDIPKSGGGLYCSTSNNGFNYEESLGRDIARGFDSNAVEKVKIFENLYQILEGQLKHEVSKEEVVKQLLNAKGNLLNDITEYGRVVHAEMEALLSCTRNGISTIGASLFCTTYPCHNCAKHIIAAGISRVVYIEPYSKSKAIDFHFESINHDNKSLDKLEGAIDVGHKKVSFESFAGIGPRLFREVFVLGDRKRKTDNTENYQEFGYVLKKWMPELITSLS